MKMAMAGMRHSNRSLDRSRRRAKQREGPRSPNTLTQSILRPLRLHLSTGKNMFRFLRPEKLRPFTPNLQSQRSCFYFLFRSFVDNGVALDPIQILLTSIIRSHFLPRTRLSPQSQIPRQLEPLPSYRCYHHS